MAFFPREPQPLPFSQQSTAQELGSWLPRPVSRYAVWPPMTPTLYSL